MTIVGYELLITSAPPESLLALGAMFSVVAVILLSLTVEAGTYPEPSGRLKCWLSDNPWTRRQWRRWSLSFNAVDRYACQGYRQVSTS